MYDVERIRYDVPILERKVGEKELVYLDNTTSPQKPRRITEVLTEHYERHNANIHRGIHKPAEAATAWPRPPTKGRARGSPASPEPRPARHTPKSDVVRRAT